MRFSAFDPRTRSLSGLREFGPRTRSLTGLRGGRLGCNQCSRGMGRLGRLGDDIITSPDGSIVQNFTTGTILDTATGNVYNASGVLIKQGTPYDPNTYVPTLGTNAQLQASGGFAPATPGGQLNPGSNPYPIITAAGSIIKPPAPPIPPASAPGTIAGIPTNYLLYGGIALLAVAMLSKKK